MEPSPPPPVSSSVSRFSPRGLAPAPSNHALQWEPVNPTPTLTLHPQPRRQNHHHHHAKVSPRHIKLQSVHVHASLPAYATTTLRDQIRGHFRHELFQFHQLLQDAVAQCTIPQDQPIKSADAQLTSEIDRSRTMLEVLTSDHHAAVMRAFFVQWQHLRQANSATATTTPPDEQELLYHLVDAIFRNLPTVLTENDVRNPTAFMRFVDTLKMMRELVLSLLCKAPAETPSNDEAEDTLTPASSGLFASTSALLAAIGGGRPNPTTRSVPYHTTVPSKRVPVYLYCQQLEHEIEALQRRLRAVGRQSRNGKHGDTVGLLDEQTLSLLVQFWELPRRERLAFFCQVASQAKPQDCDTVLRVFLDKCDTSNLLSLWDALQVTPHVQHALAIRKHSEDADAAARAAAEALALANRQDGDRHHKQHGSGSSSENGASSGEESTLTELRAGRRGKRFAVAARGGNRPSQRLVDLGGLTDVFERGDDHDDDDDGSGGHGGDGGWGHGGGKRRRRKMRIHDRGRTPDDPRGHREHSATQSGRRRAHRGDTDASTPTTPKPILERLHSTLLELLKVDDPNLDVAVSDAAWKLVESIDHRAKRHDSLAPRKLSTFPVLQPTSSSSTAGGITAQPPRGALHGDPLGANLTNEQQYFVKMDQLQSLLTSLGGVSLLAMSTDAITSAFKRLPGLLRLFQGFQSQVNAGVGLVPSPFPVDSVQATSAVTRANSVAVADMATMSVDDQMMNSVDIMLGKLGKMVRSLAPMADVGSTVASVSGGDTLSAAPTPTASSEILKLAEAMEEIASSAAAAVSTGGGRRHLSLDPARRMAVLNRLKSLAHSTQIENLTGLLTATCDDIFSLQAVTHDQQRRLQALTNDSEFLTDDAGLGDDLDGHSSNRTETDDVDDVLKLVKKAKIRRASAAKLAASSGAQTGKGDTTVRESEDDDDQSLLMNPMTAPRYANRMDISLTIKQATAQRGSKLFNAGILLRVIDQMYREHFETMVASLQYGSRRMEFSEFMYDWHIRKYGLKTLAQQHLLKLIQSLRKHERKVFACHLCLRFLGVVRPLGFHEHKFVLGLLDKWSAGSFAGAAKHRIEFVPRQFKVRITFAVATLQDALSERFGVYFRTMDAVATRIKTLAMRQDDEFITESDLLTVALDEWLAQRHRIEQILEAVYTAGDANGDGSLEFDEFCAVMGHLSPTLSDQFVQRVFTAAHDYLKPRRISLARFLDVVLLERVLNTTTTSTTGAARGKNATTVSSDRSNASSTTVSLSTSSSATATTTTATLGLNGATADDEEMYQFILLEETWTHDRDVVAQALSAIPHAPTVATLQFRVAFLTQILGKRVDAKTAWMCHRQIMREIRRYQHLDDAQIVAVKTKEETFKRAVLAIRNMQRLSVAFGRRSIELTTSDNTPLVTDEHSEPSSGDPQEHGSPRETPDGVPLQQTSYVSVVEGALDNSRVDIEALEDQIREKFLERADQDAIEDFMNAVRTIRRRSVQAEPVDLEVEHLRGASDAHNRHARASVSLGHVVEENEAELEGDDDDQDEDDDQEDEVVDSC